MAMICDKIGLDFHGVISANPKFFKEFCDLIKLQDVEIHIVSGGPYEIIGEFMQRYEIKYDKIWCIFDHFYAKNEVEFLPDGSFHIDDYEWNAAKGKYCNKHRIKVQIDDSTTYGKYFRTPYCLYDERNKKGHLKGQPIDFSDSVEKCWHQILSALSD